MCPGRRAGQTRCAGGPGGPGDGGQAVGEGRPRLLLHECGVCRGRERGRPAGRLRGCPSPSPAGEHPITPRPSTAPVSRRRPEQLARREALATTKGVSPRGPARESGQAGVQRARLFTLLVEFDPNANDDFSGWVRPNDDPTNPAVCVTEPAGTLLNGPLHNQIPDPATIGRGTDNNTFWVPDFNRNFYQQLIYSREGVQQPDPA